MQPSGAMGHRVRCLVVEKDAAQMQQLCSALEQHGYASQGTTHVQQALEGLLAGAHDLLLVNMALQPLDGIKFCIAARRIDPGLGLVLITDDANSDIPRAARSGIFDFITQPFRIESVTAILEHALESSHMRRSIAQFQEQSLRQREQLAQSARDSEVSLGHLSHDLRAPVRAISSFVQILEEDFEQALGHEGRRILQIIRANTQKIDEMIVSLLDFFRAGSRPFERDTVDMTKLAQSVADEVLLQAGASATISIGQLPSVCADNAAMRQVWVNLIANAVKFSSCSEEPRVSVRGHVQGNDVFYQIEDNGVGFDMRHVDRIFGIFERLHRSEEFAGRGMGLAIVKRVLSRHGGRICARGAPERGACFEFVIPAEDTQNFEIQPGVCP